MRTRLICPLNTHLIGEASQVKDEKNITAIQTGGYKCKCFFPTASSHPVELNKPGIPVSQKCKSQIKQLGELFKSRAKQHFIFFISFILTTNVFLVNWLFEHLLQHVGSGVSICRHHPHQHWWLTLGTHLEKRIDLGDDILIVFFDQPPRCAVCFVPHHRVDRALLCCIGRFIVCTNWYRERDSPWCATLTIPHRGSGNIALQPH